MSIVWVEKPKKEKTINPQALVSAGAIALNPPATELLGKSDSVVIGYDVEAGTIALASSSVVKEKAAIKHPVRSTKNGASVSCRKTMPVMLAELGVTIQDRKRLKCPVEVTDDNMLIIKIK